MKIGIIGTGNVGFTFAIDAKNRGHDVLLWADPEHRGSLDKVDLSSPIKATGDVEGSFCLNITPNLAHVLSSDFVIVTVVANAHDDIVEKLCHYHLKNVIFIPGAFSPLVVRNRLNADYVYATSTSPWASRLCNGEITVMGTKKILPIASYPDSPPPEVRNMVKQVFPQPLDWYPNLFALGLASISGVIHTPPIIMNAGLIERTGGDYYMYKEGMTAAVTSIMDALDQERVAVARSYGLKLKDGLTMMNEFYGASWQSWEEFAKTSRAHNLNKEGPKDMRHRGIRQDVPDVLVPTSAFGRLAGEPTPITDSLIVMASRFNNEPYEKIGRNLKRMEMDNLTKEDVVELYGPRDYNVVRKLSDYVVNARGQPSSEPARLSATKCIYDLLGALISGINETGPKAVRTLAKTTMAAGSVPIWFSGKTSSAIGAAWANSAAACALDLDDGNRLARGHPGAAIIPTAFAIAHETGATLEEIITSIVIGYEVGVTVASARTSYGNTGTWGSYAVAATAAALRDTPRDILEHALAIAGESAPNQLFQSAPPSTPGPEGNAVKEGIPWSVVTGLTSLALAEAGHTGPRNILDSSRFYLFSNDLSVGTSQHICNTYFKLYSCCRHVHPPLDTLLQLLERHPINVANIDRIDVETYSGALRIANKTKPANTVDVQYSIPYCLALVALQGPQTLLPVTNDALGHDGVISLAEKAHMRLNPEFDARFPAETLCRITIVSNGQQFVSDVTSPRGEGSNPLTWDELDDKFLAATRFETSEPERKQIMKAMNDAKTGNLWALTACLDGLVLVK